MLPNKKIKLTDLGIFKRKRSPERFVTFVIRPYLIKKYGLVKIEKIKLKKPNILWILILIVKQVY